MKKERASKKPRGMIRDAILKELARRKMTKQQLWKRARKFCPTLPNRDLLRYLRGLGTLWSDQVDAVFKVLDLEVTALQPSYKP